MSAIELRNKIIQLLNTDNIGYLKDVFEFAEKKKNNLSDDTIVAHTIEGNPITKREYIQNNADAVTSFEQGDFKTQSQIRQKYQAS